MTKFLYLGLGGIIGTFARYWLAGVIYQKFGTAFPFGTMIVNITGCFLVGLFSVVIDEKFFLGPDSRILLMVGFCGAYTTFSTYMLETSHLVMGGEMLRAFFNIMFSTVMGFIALRLGVFIGGIIQF